MNAKEMKSQLNEWRSLFKGFWATLFSIIISLTFVGLVGFTVWRVLWVTKVDNYEMAFNYNWWTGQVEKIDRTGWIIRWPIVNSVHSIDLRPYQISITADIQRNVSSGSSGIGARILNAKLVSFNPKGLDTFIKWHGRSAGDDTREMLEILKAYAFARDEGRDCPFLTVIGVVSPNQNGPLPAANPPEK